MSLSERLAQEVPSLPARASSRRTPHACERCRIKKSRCCGGTPCTKCRDSDALCVYGQKYRSEAKVHPKGYVEMLERQQRLLISAIHAMYRKQSCNKSLTNVTTSNTAPEHPRTQDILQELGLVPSSNRTSQTTSNSLSKFPPESSNHRNVEDSDFERQSPLLSSDQDALSDDICPWSCDSWLPILPSHADGLEFEAGTIPPATSAATHIPQASTIPTLACPELTPQDCTMTFHDPLLYRTPWMLDGN